MMKIRYRHGKGGLIGNLLEEVFLPFTPRGREVSGDVKKTVIAWPGRLTNQSHPSLLRGSTCLSTVTGDTGTNDIFPSMLPASVSRDDVV